MLFQLGGSLTDLQHTGQAARFVDQYLPAWLERFDRVRVFSYEPEHIDAFSVDAEVRRRVDVTVLRGRSRFMAAGRLGVLDRRALRTCAMVRVMQAPGSLPALLAGAPYVCTYGYDYSQFSTTSLPGGRMVVAIKQPLLRGLLRQCVRRARATIVTSDQGEQQARALGARRFLRVPNGVDTALFAPQPVEPDFDAVFVGRLHEQKDLPTLIEAARLVGGPMRLGFVGEGPLRESLAEQAAAGGVEVDFFGTVDWHELPDVLARGRAFVLPSRFEGHPKALIEALAVGRPCIGTDIPGIRELAAEGVVWTAPVGDAPALARLLRRVRDAPAEAAALGAAGRQLAVSRFDLRSLLGREAAALDELSRSPSSTITADAAPSVHHRNA